MCQFEEERDKLILSYFQSLFTSSSQSGGMDFLDGLNGRVTTNMNKELLKEFTKDEVKVTLDQMHPIKSPGPNGMSPIFFQQYWYIVGDSVCSTMLQAFQLGMLPSSLNHTFISLMPKKRKPKKN